MKKTTVFILLACILTALHVHAAHPSDNEGDSAEIIISPAKRYHSSALYVRLSSSAARMIEYRINHRLEFTEYTRPLAIDKPGEYMIYVRFKGERSTTDSARFVYDTTAPEIRLMPPPGSYDSLDIVHIECNEPCTFYYASGASARYRPLPSDTLKVKNSLSGWVRATDRAGNASTPRRIHYVNDTSSATDIVQDSIVPRWMDTTAPEIRVEPKPQYHNSVFHITFSANEHARIEYSINSKDSMQRYSRPVTVSTPGTHTLYYKAEDDFGNTTALDSVQYILDKTAPSLSFAPPPRRYKDPVTVRINPSEKVMLFFSPGKSGPFTKMDTDTIRISDSLDAFIAAKDRAGNKSKPVHIRYLIGIPDIEFSFSPPEGIYNTHQTVTISATPPELTLFYSFDPMTPKAWFQRYTKPVILPYGTSTLRCYAQTTDSIASDMVTRSYTVDTLAPRIHFSLDEGRRFDKIHIQTREPARISYSITDFLDIAKDSLLYNEPIALEKRGKWRIRAWALDKAGNRSKTKKITKQYDHTPPIITILPAPRTYTKPVVIRLRSNERAHIFYTTDGSVPDTTSSLYKDSLRISKEGATILSFMGKDIAGNLSEVKQHRYTVDTKPPKVRFEIMQDMATSQYRITFFSEPDATIHYALGQSKVSRRSPRYTEPFTVKPGQVIHWFALDSVGNATKIRDIDEVANPIVAAKPKGGLYNTRISIGFRKKHGTKVFWRLLPDSLFTRYRDSIRLEEKGLHTLEYYALTPEGSRSPIRQNKYVLDLSPPIPTLSLEKGRDDTAIVTIACNENASIYYTLTRSNPLHSPSMKIAGNKFLTSKARIRVDRGDSPHLTFLAEDAAGNFTKTHHINLSKPAPEANLPSGNDIVYNKALTIRLSALLEGSRIFYARHGHVPTTDSTLYTKPIPLSSSDTIIAFSVDQSGMRGALDTFIYHIDLPPVARFSVVTDSPSVNIPTVFDASESRDNESSSSQLRYCWDFTGNGEDTTSFSASPRASHRYTEGGIYAPTLIVRDPQGNIEHTRQEVFVRGRCPKGMVYVAPVNGDAYCIDKYEWPNTTGKEPTHGITWFEARMRCEQVGKRLCTPEEWNYACTGRQRALYSYGQTFQKNNCTVDGKKTTASSASSSCRSDFGVYDMVGNVREWVNTVEGNISATMGGSYMSGRRAGCRQRTPENMSTTGKEIGFRCCK